MLDIIITIETQDNLISANGESFAQMISEVKSEKTK